MKTLYCTLFLSLGLALCAGCGDNSTQSWENGKPKSSAGKSSSKPADVADNDAAGEPSDSAHGTASPHPGMNPHSDMMPDASKSALLENDGTLEIGSIHWTVPKSWDRKSPGMMVTAEYSIAHAEGDAENARFTVSKAKGSLEANIDRWKNKQFSKLDKQNQESFDVSGCKVTLVDFTGTYVGMQMPGAAPSASHADYRLLGAIVEVPKEPDMIFIKCYGPAKTIAAHADEIKGFIRSMKVDK
jgi:hypothetical protein